MNHRRDPGLIPGMVAALSVAGLVAIPAQAGESQDQAPVGQGQTATNPIRYQVNYRPTANDPWQLYAATRGLDKANAIATELQSTGYQAQVVNSLTPSPQPYPDAAETSASRYYPTSNWSSDYNYYMVPGGNFNNYGWFGGWNPGYGYRSYPNYWWNGNRSFYGAGYGGHYWGGGWRRGGGWGGAGWSGGAWNGNHRNWNNAHVDRGTHNASHERNSANAHHQYHAQHNSAGHHQPGHHAAARHASNASAGHRGTGHRGGATGARTAGHRSTAHRAAGHAARGHGARGGGGHHSSPGGHAAGHHAAHHDP